MVFRTAGEGTVAKGGNPAIEMRNCKQEWKDEAVNKEVKKTEQQKERETTLP
jgi:hypothetical protein